MSRTSSRPFRVGRAKTGLGLFATEAIRKGRTVVEYRGRRITAEQAWEIERKRPKPLSVRDQHASGPSTAPRAAISRRYINHACKPNAEAILRRTGKLEFAALAQRIEPGEEITIDYGERVFTNCCSGARRAANA